MKENKWIPKFLALFAAIFLWIYVMNDQNPLAEKVVSVPVVIQNLNDGEQVIISSMPDVSVKIRAPRLQLAEIKETEIIAYIDMKGVAAGSYMIPVKIVTPQGVEIVEIATPTIEILVDDLITQQIEVRPQFEGVLDDKFHLDAVKITPEYVTVRGPASEKDSALVAFAPIILSDKSTSFSAYSSLIIGDRTKLSSFWSVQPETVLAEVSINPKVIKEVPIILDLVGNLPPNLVIENIIIQPKLVEVSGNRQSMTNIREVSTESLNLKEFNTSKEMTIRLVLPPGISSENNEVQVKIELSKIDELKE